MSFRDSPVAISSPSQRQPVSSMVLTVPVATATTVSPLSFRQVHQLPAGAVSAFPSPLTSPAADGRGECHSRHQQTRRLVFKDGTCNVAARHVTDRKWRYLADLFTTVIDLRWRWHIIMFATAFVVSWVVFAVIWWVIAAVNGDLATAEGLSDEGKKRCVARVDDFRTALLFSIETQHTIGYGFRYTEPYCVAAIATMMMQAGVGVFIQVGLMHK
jgi:hypothetical protein